MQVQRVQNNNYNQTFGAKLQLRGAVEDLPKELIKEFETFTKSIGKNNDIVDIDIGRVSEITQTWSEMGYRTEKTDYIRWHNVASYINGKLEQRRIISNANGDKADDVKNLGEKIIGYLEELITTK